jgi:hypothetical protein
LNPDPAAVADELGDGEDRDGGPHAEGGDQHWQQHGGVAKAGHSRQRACEQRGSGD